jgi:hypothetical protein
MNATVRSTLVRAWLATALVDFLFASTLSVVYNGTPVRVWLGVASTVLGPSAIQGGARAVAVGLLLHLCVAFTWTAILVAVVSWSAWLRALISMPVGIVVAATVYGPLIWIAMSAVVIRAATGRPPTIGARWWVQLVAHIFFVALPMVTMVARGLGTAASGRRPTLEPAV